MECTPEMLQAAMKKAVEVGLVPKFSFGDEELAKHWKAVEAVVKAALDAAKQ